jgi:hypothetical protein
MTVNACLNNPQSFADGIHLNSYNSLTHLWSKQLVTTVTDKGRQRQRITAKAASSNNRNGYVVPLRAISGLVVRGTWVDSGLTVTLKRREIQRPVITTHRSPTPISRAHSTAQDCRGRSTRSINAPRQITNSSVASAGRGENALFLRNAICYRLWWRSRWTLIVWRSFTGLDRTLLARWSAYPQPQRHEKAKSIMRATAPTVRTRLWGTEKCSNDAVVDLLFALNKNVTQDLGRHIWYTQIVLNVH